MRLFYELTIANIEIYEKSLKIPKGQSESEVMKRLVKKHKSRQIHK